MNDKNTNNSYSLNIAIARSIALVSAFVAIIISILMVANYLQVKSIDPLNNKAISQMMEQLQENPKDIQLKKQIRALDLLARKAYFTHRWQVKTGGYLLFGFVLLLVLSLKYLNSLKLRLPDFGTEQKSNGRWETKILSRKYILYGGIGLFGLAFLLSFLSQNDIKKIGLYNPKKNKAELNFPSLEEQKKNWPGFRGVHGIGKAYSCSPLLEWDGPSNKNIAWKTKIPLPGYNSPILWGNKIFLSGADKKDQHIYCLDSESGAIIWQKDLNNVAGSPEKKPTTSNDTGFAAPTMATNGQLVYVLFATGDMGCFDLDGKPIWSKNLGVPNNHYGHSSSLLTYENLVIVQFDQNEGGHLYGLNALSGEVMYDILRDVEISWASPILVDTGKRKEVILNANPFVVSYNPQTGEQLWQIECMQGEVAPSLAYEEGIVFAVNEYARLVGITLTPEPKIAWEIIDDLSEVSSPLAVEGLVYMAASYGSISCYDAKTGVRYWIKDFDTGFYSSPIHCNGNIFLINMNGTMIIFKAGKEFKLLGQNNLGENTVSTPAFQKDRIYIRGYNHLYCIGK